MADLKTKVANLKDHASEYAKTLGALAKAKATKGASSAVAGIAIGVTVFLLFLFFMIFAFTALAWWIGGLLQSPALGFACVAGFFLLLIVIIILLSKKVIIPAIRNAVISKVYE